MTRVGLAAVLLIAAPGGLRPSLAAAGDLKGLDTSLAFVPADVAFYSSSLRNGEWWKSVASSRAWARLSAQPLVKSALDQLAARDGPLAPAAAFLRDPANAGLARLLGELASDEVFFYGGDDALGFAELMQTFQGVQQATRMQLLFRGQLDPKNRQQAEMRSVLEALNDDPDLVVVPDLVIGFRTRDPAEAVRQLDRLERLAKLGVAAAGDLLKGRLRRQKLGTGDFLTLSLDGGLVPSWEGLRQLEENAGDYDDLVDHLKGLTLAVSVGVRGPFVLVAVGADTDALAELGEGELLRDRPELKPLAAHADKPVLGLGYVSEEASALGLTTEEDVDGLVELAGTGLDGLDLGEKQREKIDADLGEMADAWKGALPRPGAKAGVAFRTANGSEGYLYDFAPPTGPAPVELTVLDHVGGDPVFAWAGRTGLDAKGYRAFARWAGRAFGHATDLAAAQIADEDGRAKYKKGLAAARPLLERLDEVTGTLLVPALAGGQMAFVLDARLTGAWVPGGRDLALPEPAAVWTVRDADALARAFKAYRLLVNDAIGTARKFDEDGKLPEGVAWPAPPVKKLAAGTLFTFPLPEGATDPKLLPNLALSEKLLAASLSAGHAERLLKPTPAAAAFRALVGGRPLVSAYRLDFARLIDAAGPWVEGLLVPLAAPYLPDEEQRKDLAPQVRVVLDVLRTFRGTTGVTYREGKVTVTHTATEYRDLAD